MPTLIELLDKETLGVQFDYSAALVNRIKTLRRRKWNPAHKRWEVHIAHLEELVNMLGLSRTQLPDSVLAHFNSGWESSPIKVQLGALEGRLAGPQIPFTLLEPVTSFFIPGSEFSPLVKQGKWDGRRRLLNPKTGVFPVGLWESIRDVLEREQIPYTLEPFDLPALPDERALHCGPVVRALRPYQAAAHAAAVASGRGIIQIATGGGKTLLAAHLIRHYERPALFFVHTLDLLYQAAQVFERELGIEVGILGDGQATLRPLTVATIQTAARALEGTRKAAVGWKKLDPEQPAKTRRKKSDDDESAPSSRAERELDLDDATREQVQACIERAEVVIFDECHHLPADTFYKIAMRTTRARVRLGLSATPWRDDENDLLLEAALGRRVCAVRCSDLIDQGYLVPPAIEFHAAPAPPGLPRRVPYADCYRLAIVENQQRNRTIAARAADLAAQGRSVLILVAHVAHGRALEPLLPEALFVHGALDSTSRGEYLAKLEQKLHPILIATTLADEGLDLPSLDAVILAGGGKSQTRAYQRIGRALRLAEGKREAVIVDFMDEAPFLRRHSEARLLLYRAEPRFEIRFEGNCKVPR